jgi:hypothetical protein
MLSMISNVLNRVLTELSNLIEISLCKYKDALGIPNQGIHSYRFFGVAIMDVIMTIIGAFIISYVYKISFLKTALFLFALGIVLHRIFCVRTTIDKLLFP